MGSWRLAVFSVKTISKVANVKTTIANIAFFFTPPISSYLSLSLSLPPPLPLSLSLSVFLLSFSFPCVIFRLMLIGYKNGVCLATFQSNGCNFRKVRFQKFGQVDSYIGNMWPKRDHTPLWDPTSSHEQRRIPTKLNISRRARRRFLQTVHIPQPLFSSLLQDPRLKQVRRLELILRGTKHQAEKKRRSIFFQFWSKERFFFWDWQSHFLKELSSNNHAS